MYYLLILTIQDNFSLTIFLETYYLCFKILCNCGVSSGMAEWAPWQNLFLKGNNTSHITKKKHFKTLEINWRHTTNLLKIIQDNYWILVMTVGCAVLPTAQLLSGSSSLRLDREDTLRGIVKNMSNLWQIIEKS